MGAENKLLTNNVPLFLRKHWLDVWIYVYIKAQTSLVPGISVIESARFFQRENDIDEGELTMECIRKTYYRMQNEVIAEKKAGRQVL